MAGARVIQLKGISSFIHIALFANEFRPIPLQLRSWKAILLGHLEKLGEFWINLMVSSICTEWVNIKLETSNISAFGASALERMRCGSGERRRSDRYELKSQWRPSQSRKESILNCLLMGMEMLYIHKWGKDWIEKYRSSWKRVGYWREISTGVKIMAACLGELTTKEEKEAKQWQPLWNDFELEKWKIL